MQNLISDLITKRLKEEIKTKAIKSIKDKIQEKIQSEIKIKIADLGIPNFTNV